MINCFSTNQVEFICLGQEFDVSTTTVNSILELHLISVKQHQGLSLNTYHSNIQLCIQSNSQISVSTLAEIERIWEKGAGTPSIKKKQKVTKDLGELPGDTPTPGLPDSHNSVLRLNKTGFATRTAVTEKVIKQGTIL